MNRNELAESLERGSTFKLTRKADGVLINAKGYTDRWGQFYFKLSTGHIITPFELKHRYILESGLQFLLKMYMPPDIIRHGITATSFLLSKLDAEPFCGSFLKIPSTQVQD